MAANSGVLHRRLPHPDYLEQRLPLRCGEPLFVAQLTPFSRRTHVATRRTDDVGGMLSDPIFPLSVVGGADIGGIMGFGLLADHQGFSPGKRQLHSSPATRHRPAMLRNRPRLLALLH